MHRLDLLCEWAFTASLRASVLTVFIIGLQLLLRKRLSAHGRYGLWLPVLVVLLLPQLPESRWSVASLLRLPEPAKTEAQATAASLQPSGAQDRVPAASLATGLRGFDRKACARQVWLCGAVLLGLFGGVSMAASLRRVRRSAWRVEPRLMTRIEAVAGSLGLRRAPEVWLSHHVRSPAVCGFFRPALLLNPGFLTKLNREESDLVLRHELTHIRRGDLLLHAAMCLLLAVHWFNPVLWLAFFRVRMDREAACDADVLRNESRDGRVAYGRALLKMETEFRVQGLCLGFVGMTQGGSSLRSRIQLIVAQPPMSPLMKAALALMIAGLTFGGITKAAEEAPQVRIEVKLLAVADDAVLDEAARQVLHMGKGAVPPAQGQSLGTLQGVAMQTLMRSLSSAKGVDLLCAPVLMARSGQEASVEVGRDFKYALPDQTNASKWLGIGLRAKATLQPSGEFEMELSPKIVEISGFEETNGTQQPLFREHQAQIRVMCAPGAAVMLEMPAETFRQTVVEPQPGQPDKITDTQQVRRRFAFITTSLVAPGADTTPREGASLDVVKRKLQTIVIPQVRFREAPVTEVVKFLQAQSAEFDPSPAQEGKGVPLLLRAEQIGNAPKLTLNLEQVPLEEALKYVTQLANLKYEVRPYAVVIAGDLPAAKASPMNPAVKTKGGDLVLPDVELQDVKLAQALALIRNKSIEADPAKQGVIILLNNVPDQVKFSLSLRNVPVDDALRYVAELAGCKLVRSAEAYTLAPPEAK